MLDTDVTMEAMTDDVFNSSQEDLHSVPSVEQVTPLPPSTSPHAEDPNNVSVTTLDAAAQPLTKAAAAPQVKKRRIYSSHPRDKGIACARFLRNGACPVHNCPYMHVTSETRMPVPSAVCGYYLRARCLRDQCPFMHLPQANLDALVAAGATEYAPLDGVPVRDPLESLPSGTTLPCAAELTGARPMAPAGSASFHQGRPLHVGSSPHTLTLTQGHKIAVGAPQVGGYDVKSPPPHLFPMPAPAPVMLQPPQQFHAVYPMYAPPTPTSSQLPPNFAMHMQMQQQQQQQPYQFQQPQHVYHHVSGPAMTIHHPSPSSLQSPLQPGSPPTPYLAGASLHTPPQTPFFSVSTTQPPLSQLEHHYQNNVPLPPSPHQPAVYYVVLPQPNSQLHNVETTPPAAAWHGYAASTTSTPPTVNPWQTSPYGH